MASRGKSAIVAARGTGNGTRRRRYTATLTTLQHEIVNFLRTFEAIQEDLRLGAVAEMQAQLVAAVGDTFRRFDATFAPLTPPESMADLHEPLCAAITELGKACNVFMTKPSRDWTLAFLYSRT